LNILLHLVQFVLAANANVAATTITPQLADFIGTTLFEGGLKPRGTAFDLES
jgi:hypothetical protein